MSKTRARPSKARFEKWKCVNPGNSHYKLGEIIKIQVPAKVWDQHMQAPSLPSDAKARKDIPMVRGLLDYFPAALAAVAEVSRIGNEQHNPGQPMHHARGKSTDHADCIVRHLMDRGTIDTDGIRHSAKVVWRALALLQEELEGAGAPLARGAKLPEEKKP